jgi:hypothetical protein
MGKIADYGFPQGLENREISIQRQKRVAKRKNERVVAQNGLDEPETV